jgi:hypothetical protein
VWHKVPAAKGINSQQTLQELALARSKR